MNIRDHLSPAALVDWLIIKAFRLGAFRLAEGLVCWGKGNHQQQLIRFQVPDGPSLWLNPSNYIDRVLIVEGQHDREVIDAIGSLVRDGDVFWDIGANIGLIGLSLLHKFPQLKVVAFEPSPFTYSQLFLNDRLNGGRMQMLPMALADSESYRSFSMKVNRNTGQSTLEPDEKYAYDACIGVYCQTGDQMIARNGLPSPTLIKIDVEGAEHLVFQGLTQTLRSPGLRAVIFEDSAKNHETLVGYLKDAGFTSIRQLPGKGQANFLAERA